MENSAKIVLPLVSHGSWNLRFSFSRRRFHDSQRSYRLTIWSPFLPSIKKFWLKSHLYRNSLSYQLEVERGEVFWSIHVIWKNNKKIKFHIKNKWKKIKLKPISVMLVADTAWTGHFFPEHIPFSLTPGFTMEPRLALNSQYCCLNFPREEITGLYCHTRFSLCCFLYCFYVETASSCVAQI